MIRTFIAVEVSEDIRKNLGRQIQEFRAAAPLVNWSKQDNLHLTLRFLGDIKETDLDELFDAVGDAVADLTPFALELKGVGAFPNWRCPRVVWAGCGEGADEAVQLAESVEAACVDVGYDAEKRAFRPHLTLGRVKQPADVGGLAGAAEGLLDREFGFLDVDEIVVFMSELRRGGPVYAPMARFSLGG